MSVSGMSEEAIRRMLGPLTGAGPAVAPARFSQLEPAHLPQNPLPIEFLGDIHVILEVRLGEARLTVRDVLDLKEGSTLELNRMAGEQVEMFVNDKLLGSGEVVVINEVFGLRLNTMA